MNQAVGQSDINEQAKRTICQCVTRETVYGTDAIVGSKDVKQYYLEAAITTRATMITRMNLYYGGGCKCKTHRQLFFHALKEYTNIVSVYGNGDSVINKRT
jgi:hypothetical protein